MNFLFFDVQEFDFLFESVSCCGCYGVVALLVVAVYLNTLERKGDADLGF